MNFLTLTFSTLTALTAVATAAPAQAHLVSDLEPGIAGSIIGGGAMDTMGDLVVFAARVSSEVHLYKSDGTAGGTTLIKVLDDTLPLSTPTWFCTVGTAVYFDYGDSTTGSELWKTDGTALGTGLVKDIRTGGVGSYPSQMTNVAGTLYFSASGTSGNHELWKSDGTSAGTTLVKDIHPTAGAAPRDLCQLGSTGTFLFAATDGVTNGWELWKSDGTTAGTVLVKDINPGGGAVRSSNPRYLTKFGDKVAFAACEILNDYELWVSDGTEAGTEQVTFAKFGNTGMAGPRHVVAQNGKLFFQAAGMSAGNALWVSDGTDAGTVSISTAAGFMMTAVGSRYVFFNGGELWRTDGTVLGTAEFQELWVGSGYGDPIANGYPSTHLRNSRYAVTTSGKMFFYAADPIHGIELWAYDTGINAEASPHGSACSGLTLAATNPYLGETCTITTSGIPAGAVLTALALSFTKHSPGIDLTSLGMPGCYQHVGLDSVHFLFGSPSASFSLSVPPGSSWLGAKIQCQAFTFVPGINAAGVISSNGLELVFGDQ